VNKHEHKDLDAAQALIYAVFEADSTAERIKLAKMALQISKHCADAYTFLAQETTVDLKQKHSMLEKAVAAGEAAMGVDDFRRFSGETWEFLETKPYMRARASLADCLWELGQREQSVDHLVDMLNLNREDSLGLRFVVVSRLIALGRLDMADQILTYYQDNNFADWAFNTALLKFINNTANPEAGQALEHAMQVNEFVVEMLVGDVEIPKSVLHGYAPGSKEEAIFYVRDNMENWQSAKGALGSL